MITKEQLNKYKEWGLTLIPLTTDTKNLSQNLLVDINLMEMRSGVGKNLKA